MSEYDWTVDQAYREYAALRAQRDRLLTVARALVQRLDECDKPLFAALTVAQLHGAPYSGPQYGEELEAARSIIEEIEGK
jgi:hypothetical protein